jgi:type II secretory ATPase GspE/PulE/Tfp pilus assembly ATPase PilB-like protein
MGAFETAFFNDNLRNAVKQAKSLPDIGTELRRARMRYLQEQILLKVIAGITSIQEMIRVLSKSTEIRQAEEEQ